MDISPVTALSSLDTVYSIGARQTVFPPLSTDTVSISDAGKLLSASTLFEASQTDFASLSVATQYFADAYNNFLQSGILQSSVSGALNLPFVQALNASLNISGLSAIGVSLSTGEITVDYQALQAAFIANPSGTVSLLAQAALSTGQFAAQFAALSAQLNSLPLSAAATAATAAPAAAATQTTTAAANTATTSTTAATATAAATNAATQTTPAASTTIAAATTPTTAAIPATAAATTAPPAAAAQVNASGPPVVNSADPAIAAAIASYHVIDGIFDMAKPHDKGPAPKTPVYSEIGNITAIQPVVLNLHT